MGSKGEAHMSIEADQTVHRWHWRRAEQPSRWYPVTYVADMAWLVGEGQDRVKLEEGMQLDVARLVLTRPIVEPKARKRPRKRGDSGPG